MQVTSHRFETLADAKAYALAGNATITLQSLKTGVHFTYKIRLADEQRAPGRDPSPAWFVKILSAGSADEGEFTYIGMIKNGRFGLTRASRVTADSPCVKAFTYFMHALAMPEQLTVRHEGRCGRCGRTLTVPESIDAGIGPECAAIMEGGRE
jgi:hypothetical protein